MDNRVNSGIIAHIGLVVESVSIRVPKYTTEIFHDINVAAIVTSHSVQLRAWYSRCFAHATAYADDIVV